MGEFVDWLFGGDRRGMRVLLGIFAVLALLLLAEFAYHNVISPSEGGICREYPESRICLGEPMATFTPAEIQRITDDVLKELR